MDREAIWKEYHAELTREWREMPGTARDMIPGHLQDGLDRYICDRVRPGQFLCAVLGNDLLGAVRRADRLSYAGMPGIVEALIGYAPATAWGSESKVAAWLLKGDGP